MVVLDPIVDWHSLVFDNSTSSTLDSQNPGNLEDDI